MLLRQGRSQKKLVDAAQHWAARPRQSAPAEDDERYADPQEWQDAIDAHDDALAADEEDEGDDDDVCIIWPENEQTWQVFCALSHCWRIDGMSGQCHGLDRPAIESTLRLMKIKRKKHQEIFLNLLAMEEAALSGLNRPPTTRR